MLCKRDKLQIGMQLVISMYKKKKFISKPIHNFLRYLFLIFFHGPKIFSYGL